MANMTTVLIGFVMMAACLMMSPQAYVVPGRIQADVLMSSQPRTDIDETMMSEMMTSEEEEMVDELLPNIKMKDDLKLELILKALVILKKFEGESISVSTWFPSYDVMPDELKLRLILKAIILLKDRPLDAMFAGHTVQELELTLILKALWIIQESKVDFGLAIDIGKLKLILLLKAIDILEVYKGEFKDVVFFTVTKEQLKLKLILKAITLLKGGVDFWPMEGEGEEEGGQSEASTTSEAVTEQKTTEEVETTEGTTADVEVTSEGATEEAVTKKFWFKHGIHKAFKWLKKVPHVIHKKKHHIFH